jgi:hypothetical protein
MTSGPLRPARPEGEHWRVKAKTRQEPEPWSAVVGATRPPGAPEDDHLPLSIVGATRRSWPQQVTSVGGAVLGSRWQTTVPLRLADPRGYHGWYHVLTLVPPALGEAPSEHWIEPGTVLTLVEVRDDHLDPDLVKFAQEDPATFYLHFGFWAYVGYRIETGRWAGITVYQMVEGGENQPRSSQIAHTTLEPLPEGDG